MVEFGLRMCSSIDAQSSYTVSSSPPSSLLLSSKVRVYCLAAWTSHLRSHPCSYHCFAYMPRIRQKPACPGACGRLVRRMLHNHRDAIWCHLARPGPDRTQRSGVQNQRLHRAAVAGGLEALCAQFDPPHCPLSRDYCAGAQIASSREAIPAPEQAGPRVRWLNTHFQC